MMGDEIETLVVKVRADTGGFMAGLADVRRELDGPLAQGVGRAGSSIERALTRAALGGRFGFEELRRIALGTLADIAASALKLDFGALFGSGGLGQGLASLAGSLLGLPGRATGGPVTAGRAYVVGERGPELFVPTASGRVDAGTARQNSVAVTVNVAAPREATPAVMQQTGRQVARAVARALRQAEG